MAPKKRLTKIPRVVQGISKGRFVGGWLPNDPEVIRAFVRKLVMKVRALKDIQLLPCVQDYQDLIETDPRVNMGAVLMIQQQPPDEPTDPSGGPLITNYRMMCQLINTAISEPPPYNDSGLVAFPINAIINWTMGTEAGHAYYLMSEVNDKLKAILDFWGEYLCTSDSLVAFEDPPQGGGWMTEAAKRKLHMDWYKPGTTGDKLAWGYPSWNDWFIREFLPGMRDVEDPDTNLTIANACESTPFRIEQNVQLFSEFWIKSQPYSLKFLLNNHPKAEEFVGGMVYQAFLSAFDYHRWHSPVNGTIIHAEVVPGSYYAESPSVGKDEAGPDLSQGYISNVAARAVILIKADEPGPGLVGFVAIGMSEVSSNVLSVEKDDPINKGQELGYFQFGGSTHCVIFKKDVIKMWSEEAIPSTEKAFPLSATIASICEAE